MEELAWVERPLEVRQKIRAIIFSMIELFRVDRVVHSSTWFGTRRSEVQILSPRPILFNNLHPSRGPKKRTPGNAPGCHLCCAIHPNNILRELKVASASGTYKRVYVAFSLESRLFLDSWQNRDQSIAQRLPVSRYL